MIGIEIETFKISGGALLKKQRIKKEKRKQEFLLNHHSSKFVSKKSQKLRCQITGCRNGAVTLLGKKKVCQNHGKKEVI